MNWLKLFLTTCLFLFINASLFAVSDLGKIEVESSTIDDRFESKKREASSISTISGGKVDASKAENIQRVLQQIPGVTSELQGGDSLKIHIRGVENQRFMGEKPGVAVVIDGVPVFERTGRVNIDMDNIESIKIIKGGASYLFGDDALSGAVIITTKGGASNPGAKIELETGAFGYKKYLTRYGVSEDSYNAYIQASQREKDGYHEDSDNKAEYVNGKMQYYIDDDSDIRFGFEHSDRNKNSHGTVTGETEAQNNPESVWTVGNDGVRDYAAMYDVELLKLYTTYSKDFDSGENLLVNLYQYDDKTKYYSGYADYDIDHNSITDPSFKPYLNDYKQVQRGIKSEYRGELEKSAYMLGVDLRKNNYKNKVSYATDWAQKRGPTWKDYTKGTVTENDDTDENISAIYGEYKYAINPALNVTGNIRLDIIKLEYTSLLDSLNIDKDFEQSSYRIGLNKDINNDLSFYSSFSTGFRAPSIKQLFLGDIDPTGDTISNPDLKPEEAQSLDIGVRGEFNKNISYEAGLFIITRDDYIMSSSGQYGGTATKEQYQNIGGMKSQGLELTLNGSLSKQSAYNVAYTYTDAKFTKYDNYSLLLGDPYGTNSLESYNLAGNLVPRVSKHNLNLVMDYKVNDKLTLSPEIQTRSSYYADELNRLKISGYTVVNFLASYKTKANNLDMKFFTRIDNLLDKTYYNSARAYRDSNEDDVYDREDMSLTVNEGRTINVGVEMNF